MNKDQTSTEQAQCCIDYCTNDFKSEEGVVTNRFKCDSRKITAADMWQIQKKWGR